MGGTLAVHGILAALLARERTGKGEKIELSLLDGQLYLLTYIAQYYFHSGNIPGPVGSGHQSNVIYQALKTKDISIVVVALRDHHFERFCRAIDRPEWAKDERFATRSARLKNRAALIAMIESVLQTKSGDEWLEKIHKAGVPAGPINTIDRALNDPQVLAREMIVELDGPSGEKIRTIGSPFKTTEVPAGKFSPPPRLGEHTREVLSSILGYSSERIDLLAKDGIIKKF
jgi:crotonobetainyl-CoA:carnitine CoA-transferase CaiB-like acyl-CoA transferase